MEEITLATVDSKGKIRIAAFQYEWSDTENGYVITRQTGCYGGKMTEQPAKIITVGKAKRTLAEQVVLEFNSLVKKSKDKGYKELEKDLSEYTESELHEFVGKEVTGQNGIVKPQLAKQADKVTNLKVFDKEYYASRKIDGCRCLIYLGNDGNIHTSSRGAMNYDAAMMEIIEHPTLIKLFQDNPSLILDGEAYKHGLSLASISGLMRTQVTATDYSIAEFYWYDIVNTNKSFEERLKIMNQIKSDLNLGFDPYKEWNDGDLRIQFVPQEPISGYDNMIKLHDQYVSEGWEGLVIRNKDDVYGPNKRTNSMIKLKQYKVDTFKVIGIEQGLRKYDDMCFVIEMSNGNTFKAKPMGNHELKVDYTENFETVYKNHLGDVKYFADSEHGVVQQPCFIAFRFDLE